MKALYSTYTEEDILIIVSKRKDGGISTILEKDFNPDLYDENEYLIFAYCDEYGIFNNGIRHIYEGRLNEDLSNLKILYKNEEVKEVGLLLDRYITVYKSYETEEIKNEVNKIILDGGNYFDEKIDEEKSGGYKEGELLYFYDGEAFETTVFLSGESEIEIEIPIKLEILEEIQLLLSSVRRDERESDSDILISILKGLSKRLDGTFSRYGIINKGIVECD